MTRIALCLAVTLIAAPPVFAQAAAQSSAQAAPLRGQLRLPELAGLADKASETVTVTFDQSLLRLASSWLSPDDPDQMKAKKLVNSLDGIYVRSFSFDSDFAYPKADIDALRRQLNAPGWNRMVEVRSKKESTDLDVFMLVDGGKARGLAIIASEPRQFTIVNIVGSINLEELRDLQGNFGVPDLELEKKDEKAPPKKK